MMFVAVMPSSNPATIAAARTLAQQQWTWLSALSAVLALNTTLLLLLHLHLGGLYRGNATGYSLTPRILVPAYVSAAFLFLSLCAHLALYAVAVFLEPPPAPTNLALAVAAALALARSGFVAVDPRRRAAAKFLTSVPVVCAAPGPNRCAPAPQLSQGRCAALWQEWGEQEDGEEKEEEEAGQRVPSERPPTRVVSLEESTPWGTVEESGNSPYRETQPPQGYSSQQREFWERRERETNATFAHNPPHGHHSHHISSERTQKAAHTAPRQQDSPHPPLTTSTTTIASSPSHNNNPSLQQSDPPKRWRETVLLRSAHPRLAWRGGDAVAAVRGRRVVARRDSAAQDGAGAMLLDARFTHTRWPTPLVASAVGAAVARAQLCRLPASYGFPTLAAWRRFTRLKSVNDLYVATSSHQNGAHGYGYRSAGAKARGGGGGCASESDNGNREEKEKRKKKRNYEVRAGDRSQGPQASHLHILGDPDDDDNKARDAYRGFEQRASDRVRRSSLRRVSAASNSAVTTITEPHTVTAAAAAASMAECGCEVNVLLAVIVRTELAEFLRGAHTHLVVLPWLAELPWWLGEQLRKREKDKNKRYGGGAGHQRDGGCVDGDDGGVRVVDELISKWQTAVRCGWDVNRPCDALCSCIDVDEDEDVERGFYRLECGCNCACVCACE